MRVNASVITATIIGSVIVAAQDTSDQELALLLAHTSTRQNAVSKVLASGRDKVPLLLRWTQNTPPQVDKYELYIGLADAFGQLKTKEAIPFLIKNIGLSRWGDVNTWLKSPKVIQERSPAVAALVRIGPEALKALIQAYWEPMLTEDRLAAIFTVSIIAAGTDDSEARTFLNAALGEANLERTWASEGLKRLDSNR
jgi:hypothetical protein